MTKKTERVIVLIDGSNFYHRLKEIGCRNLLSFDFAALLKHLVQKNKLVSAGYYVGVIRTEAGNPKSHELFRQQITLFGRLTRQGVTVHRGFLLKVDHSYHEKGVDVMIATHLLSGAFRDKYDTAILISSDSDLIPAIVEAQSIDKTVHYVGFHHKPSYALLKACKQSTLLTKNDIAPFVHP